VITETGLLRGKNKLYFFFFFFFFAGTVNTKKNVYVLKIYGILGISAGSCWYQFKLVLLISIKVYMGKI